jgi:hypothetical protein
LPQKSKNQRTHRNHWQGLQLGPIDTTDSPKSAKAIDFYNTPQLVGTNKDWVFIGNGALADLDGTFARHARSVP